MYKCVDTRNVAWLVRAHLSVLTHACRGVAALSLTCLTDPCTSVFCVRVCFCISKGSQYASDFDGDDEGDDSSFNSRVKLRFIVSILPDTEE